ncbi:MAG: hypothetical protein QXK27_02105 [Candidatus Hadarchaeales archaeon]
MGEAAVSQEPKRIFEHLDKLAYEIGPRPAGSRGERLAREYVRETLRKRGLEVKVVEFSFWFPSSHLYLAPVFPALLFVLSPSAVFLLWLCFLLFIFSKRVRSADVLGTCKGRPILVLAAQLDSGPPAVRALSLLAPYLLFLTVPLFLRLWRTFSLWPLLPLWVVPPLCFRALRNPSSPGANDASGLSLLLELSEVLRGKRIWFAACGAVERSRNGVKAITKVLPKQVPVLCLERVGRGSSLVLRGSQRLCPTGVQNVRVSFPQKTDMCYPLISAGFVAASLTFDSPHQDTAEDLPEHLSIKSLEMAGAAVLKLVGQLTDASLEADSGKQGDGT